MSNDDPIFGATLAFVAGSAAGYAAGRWLVEPWLGSRQTLTTKAHRSLAMGPADPYAGPSSAMQPMDPYGDLSTVFVPGAPAASDTKTAAGPPGRSPPHVDGSLTSAPQVAITATTQRPVAKPTSDRKFAATSGVRRFDPVFERYRGTLPLTYVRALVERESDGRPEVRTGSAVGLMQIVPVVLADYNKRHGTLYPAPQLVDPATNVAIGCELLRLIIESYRKNHPRVPNLQADWTNPRFVELLTFGWNAGFSEAGGVGRVARYLERQGAVDITLDLVAAQARAAGASKHLSNAAKVAWCKSVVTLYQREQAFSKASTNLVA